jgi:glycosyltransferase involved in cell wall biosynthesis
MNENFSVIIPLFNKGPFIARAIESVLHQTIQNFEIIVIDGQSYDDGPEIVKNFNDSRILFFVQSGKGVSNARNEGVNLAKNDFIAFLDADDEWMPNHLETIIELINKFPEAGIFSTTIIQQTTDGRIQQVDYKCIPTPPWQGLLPDYFKSGALGFSPVCTSVVVIPKKVFINIGGFPEGFWFGEDLDLFGKIALKYPVAFSWELGAIYHLDDINSLSNRMPPLDYEEPFVKTARAALKSGDVPPELSESLNEYISTKEIFRAVCNLRAGRSKNAEIILKQCKTRLQKRERLKWLLLSKIPSPLYLFQYETRRKFNLICKKYLTYR